MRRRFATGKENAMRCFAACNTSVSVDIGTAEGYPNDELEA